MSHRAQRGDATSRPCTTLHTAGLCTWHAITPLLAESPAAFTLSAAGRPGCYFFGGGWHLRGLPSTDTAAGVLSPVIHHLPLSISGFFLGPLAHTEGIVSKGHVCRKRLFSQHVRAGMDARLGFLTLRTWKVTAETLCSMMLCTRRALPPGTLLPRRPEVAWQASLLRSLPVDSSNGARQVHGSGLQHEATFAHCAGSYHPGKPHPVILARLLARLWVLWFFFFFFSSLLLLDGELPLPAFLPRNGEAERKMGDG